MKKILLSLIVIAVIGFSAKVQGQCDLKEVTYTINSSNPSGSNCLVDFDLSFKLKNNGGNKTVVIQAWKEADYPNYFGTNCDQNTNTSPKAADLRKTTSPYSPGSPGPLPFLNIAFDIQTQSAIASSNYPGGGVTLGSGYTVTVGSLDPDGYYPITLSNLVVTVSGSCGAGITILADVWSSQGSINSQWQPHCIICNNKYAFNYPVVTGDMNCLNPRMYSIRIENINTDQSITCSWKTYRDDNANGILDLAVGGDPLVDDQSSNFQIIPAGGNYTSGFIYGYTGNTTPPSINKNLIIAVTTVGLENDQLALASGGCSPLPVDFKSFSATRNHSNVLLKWETSTELNNTGFAVERNTNGTWQQVGFVASQATGGNSNDILSYQFTDFNNTKGISQYRIRQIDFDNRSKYSEIRSVRGESQIGQVIVYPNPSIDGRVNVSFVDASGIRRDVSVADMSGRTLRQWRGITNNNLQIENLQPGMYTLRVVVPTTGEQTVTKIVVNKR